jgi:2-phospho-L-lactate guanylyltransferase
VRAGGGAGTVCAAGTDLCIIIGLKRLADAKQRLAPALSLEERRELMLRMLTRVVTEARSAALGTVSLATSEPTATQIAASLRIAAASDGDLPWNQGLVHALDQVQPHPAAVLYLAGDLPQLTAGDLHAFTAAAPARGVAIARARDGGTNALLVCPAALMSPMFGHVRSSDAHAARAAELGLEHRTVDIAGLALDVDTITDAREAGVLTWTTPLAAADTQRRGR